MRRGWAADSNHRRGCALLWEERGRRARHDIRADLLRSRDTRRCEQYGRQLLLLLLGLGEAARGDAFRTRLRRRQLNRRRRSATLLTIERLSVRPRSRCEVPRQPQLHALEPRLAPVSLPRDSASSRRSGLKLARSAWACGSCSRNGVAALGGREVRVLGTARVWQPRRC